MSTFAEKHHAALTDPQKHPVIHCHHSMRSAKISTKYADGETGLVYYCYRFYDPANGRWILRGGRQHIRPWLPLKNCQ